jgi:hypothetical protein
MIHRRQIFICYSSIKERNAPNLPESDEKPSDIKKAKEKQKDREKKGDATQRRKKSITVTIDQEGICDRIVMDLAKCRKLQRSVQ